MWERSMTLEGTNGHVDRHRCAFNVCQGGVAPLPSRLDLLFKVSNRPELFVSDGVWREVKKGEAGL